MRKILTVMVLCISIALTASAQGIKFVSYKNWDELLAKAKSEHKYIFMNCYMEGGAPCIEMDEHTYPDKNVGNFYNKNFISVSVNMMPSPSNKNFKLITDEATRLHKLYIINGFPNLLFINPDGVLVHQVLGTEQPGKLIETGHDALDPKKQIFTKFAAFQAGRLDTSEMVHLAIDADQIDSHQLAVNIANAYIKSKTDEQLLTLNCISIIQHILKDEEKSQKLAKIYLSRLSDSQKVEPDNIHLMLYSAGDQALALQYAELLVIQSPDSVLARMQTARLISRCSVLQGTQSKCFQYLFSHQQAADRVFNKKGSLDDMIDKMVTQQHILPLLKNAMKAATDTVNWAKLETTLASKFGDLVAERNTLAAQVEWYNARKNWPGYTNAIVINDRKYGSKLSDADVNRKVGWPLFSKSSNITELKYGISRMQAVVKMNKDPQLVDTYANLLYKTGEKSEAIKWEKEAVAAKPDEKGLQSTLDKMNKGLPTWSDQE